MEIKTLKSCTCEFVKENQQAAGECHNLVTRSLNGDQSAQTAILQKFERLADFMIQKHRGNLQPSDRDEFRQAIALDWLTLMPNWDPQRWSFCYWCAMKAGNRLTMDSRKAQRQPIWTQLDYDVPVPHPEHSPVDPVISDCLKNVTRGFRDDWQQALQLHLDDHSQTEIAQLFGISRRQVYNWLTAMFQRLAERCL